jgi:hypothetical protein
MQKKRTEKAPVTAKTEKAKKGFEKMDGGRDLLGNKAKFRL